MNIWVGKFPSIMYIEIRHGLCVMDSNNIRHVLILSCWRSFSCGERPLLLAPIGKCLHLRTGEMVILNIVYWNQVINAKLVISAHIFLCAN
jgi:hypothetical protein